MKKVLLAAFALVVLSTSAFAQNGRFSIGAELGLPMGTFGDGFNLGFGGSLRYELPVGDNLGITGTAGYLTFSGKDLPDDYSITWSMIPVMVGLKYYVQEQQSGFYVAGAIGITASTLKVEIGDASASTSETDLSFAPGVGYHLDNIDLGVNYNIISTEGESTSYLGLRIAYVFGEK